MTIKRKDGLGSDFSEYIRNHPDLDSSKGYTCTDIDFIFTNYKTGEFIVVEEKCYEKKPSKSQLITYKQLDIAYRTAFPDKYKGVYIIQFTKTSPENGFIMINRRKATEETLLRLFQFDNEVLEMYSVNNIYNIFY